MAKDLDTGPAAEPAEPSDPDVVLDAGDAGYSKTLQPRHISMIAIGGAIGTGLFLGAGGNLAKAGPGLAVAYGVCGVFAFFVVRALGELVVHRPSSGAFVSYAREFLGEKGAYVAGWMYFLNWATSGMADITAIALYVHYWSMFTSVPQWVLALIALAIVLCVNLISVRLFGEMEFWFAIVKVVAIVTFLVIGVWVLITRHPVDGQTPGLHLLADNGGLFPLGVLPVILVAQTVIFAYASIEMVGVTAGETARPQEVVPRAVNSIMWRIAVFYVGSVLMLVLLLPWTSYSAGQSPFVTVLSGLGIPSAGGLMNMVVLTAAMSSLNSGLYTTGRILRSMAMAGSAPGFTSRMSRSHVPYGGVLLTSAVILCGVGLNAWLPDKAFGIVTNIAALGIIATWCMIMICHLAFVRRARLGLAERPAFRLWAAPWVNLVTLAFLLGVIVMMWFDTDGPGRDTVLLILPIAAALAIGWYRVRARVRDPLRRL
ncbi:amino acid permease [Streptomyces sp. N35]|uniref:amino acid permease n=1 Tax=Streptomyces sp. N35 TaxID=2795730 RepID=UPI0018F34147|nr:amino acid permease [Streptomyces sp. N35]